MNWGYKIVISFVAFLMFLGVLVYRSIQSKVNLVAPDYYQQEISFQEQIDKISNENALQESVEITHNSEVDELTISFPVEMKVSDGKIVLYRPSDASMDRYGKLKLDEKGIQNLSTSSLASGLWKVKVEWTDQLKSYYKEQTLFLP